MAHGKKSRKLNAHTEDPILVSAVARALSAMKQESIIIEKANRFDAIRKIFFRPLEYSQDSYLRLIAALLNYEGVDENVSRT